MAKDKGLVKVMVCSKLLGKSASKENMEACLAIVGDYLDGKKSLEQAVLDLNQLGGRSYVDIAKLLEAAKKKVS